MNTSVAIAPSVCGECLAKNHLVYSHYADGCTKGLFVVCPNRRIWNFWMHTKLQHGWYPHSHTHYKKH